VNASILEARDCRFRYRGNGFRLDGVSLAVSAGEVVGIVGPNGSGKSTLLRLLSGILVPHGGEVLLEGRPIGTLGRRQLARRLAFLPQSPETSFHFRVREVVAMGRYPHLGAFGFPGEHDVDVVERALVQTDTESLAARVFATLSGGEKQRVLIASVLAQEPAAMLLDEPTAALDIHHRSDVFDLLWRLSRSGIAVVTVTHDLNAASQFCDRLVLLKQGRVARAGRPAEVMDARLLSDAYGADVRIVDNPITSGPMAIVPGRAAHEAT